LSDTLQGFPPPTDPNLLVGFESSDDAAVYRLNDSLAVISTVDFITPPVDDPVWFGKIAAANSLSDVYAMGGKPITALSLVMFPTKKLEIEVLQGILQGGYEKVAEAGASLAGGHSVEDEEPKYGLAVTGVVSPQRILKNTGARPGDQLLLTKPLGTGVLFNACRAGKLPWPDLEMILDEVASLNGRALEVALRYDVNACTDVTGFGILGHGLEMARGSGVRLDFSYSALPFYPNALEMYQRGETTGSNKANRELVHAFLQIGARLTPQQYELLFDPQTSGGLLLSIPRDQAEDLLVELHTGGVSSARRVGQVVESPMPGLRLLD
jgi:selenide, water dikinase